MDNNLALTLLPINSDRKKRESTSILNKLQIDVALLRERIG